MRLDAKKPTAWIGLPLGLFLLVQTLAVTLSEQRRHAGDSVISEHESNDTEKILFLPQDYHVKLNLSSVKFTLYTPNCSRGEPLLIGRSVMNKTCFDPERPLKVLAHGWTEMGYAINSMIPIRLAYFKAKQDVNVLVADYGIHAVDGNYLHSVKHVEEIGNYLARFLYYIYETTVFRDMSNVHIIGFSLGGHVAGYASRKIRELTGQRVGRITGLDPAGPGFHALIPKDRLTKDDADFLDIIHGDTDTYGGNFQGHANFYPNGGKKQPGCFSLLAIFIGCGHRRTPQWFAESIMNPRRFRGCRCSSYDAFAKNKCNCVMRNNIAWMGEFCDPRTRGNFYLTVKQADHVYVVGIYPNVISMGLTNHGQINNVTVPDLSLEDALPTIPSINYTAFNLGPDHTTLDFLDPQTLLTDLNNARPHGSLN